jgi:TolA-binding protein
LRGGGLRISRISRPLPGRQNAGRAWFNIGNCHYSEQRYKEAAQAFGKAIDTDPADFSLAPRALFMKGMSLKPIDVEAAVAAWREIAGEVSSRGRRGSATEQLCRLGR